MEYVTEKRNLSEEVGSFVDAMNRRHLHIHDLIPFCFDLRNDGQPEGNWKSVEYFMPCVETTEASLSHVSGGNSHRRGTFANSIRTSLFSANNNIMKNFVAMAESPTEIHNLHDVQMNEHKSELSCFL